MGRGKREEHFKVQGLMMAEMDLNFLFLNFELFDVILIKYDVRWCWFNESEYVKIFVGAARAGEAAPYLFKVGNEQKSLRSFRVT